MKFRFRLSSILSLIDLQEKRKKVEVAHTLRRVDRIKEESEHKSSTIKNLSSKTGKKDWMLWKDFYTQKIESALDSLEQLDSQLVDEVERLELKRSELGQLSARKDALSNLKERQRKEFKRQQDKKEQKEAEDSYQSTKRLLR